MTDDDDDINDYQHPIDGLDHWVNLLKGNDAFSYTYVSCSAGKEETEAVSYTHLRAHET